jgi:hypothetical protein
MGEPVVYVVRVYRRDAAGIAGVVEAVATGEQSRFHTAEALWRALHDLPSSRRNFPTMESDQEDGR